MNMKISTSKLSIALFGIGVLAVSSLLWTYIQANNGEITVCVKENGAMYLIGEGFKRTECKDKHKLLSWNIQGPQGEKGEKGDQGESGPQGPPGIPAIVLPENLKPTPINKQFCFIPTGSGLRDITAKWGLQNEFGAVPAHGISWGSIHLVPANGSKMSFTANGTGSELTVDVGSALVGFEGTVELDANIFWGNFIIPVTGSKLLTIDFDGRGCHLMEDSGVSIAAIVSDTFNSYLSGSIIGQGGWVDRVNGNNFIVQDTTVFEGATAIHNNTQADSVIAKIGSPFSDGRQAVYIKTENRDSWGDYPDGNVQMRISKGGWDSSTMASVTFKKDGNVAYYDPALDTYTNFGIYNDNEWTLVEVEWRSSDRTARYRVNNGTWTDWLTFKGASSFTNFDNVGLAFVLPSGSGGVYFDTLH
ncbi:MAG: collagen-like protein [Patescibacteria group bacterium]